MFATNYLKVIVKIKDITVLKLLSMQIAFVKTIKKKDYTETPKKGKKSVK